MISDFISLLYPRVCELCGNGLTKAEKLICIKCNFLLPRFQNQFEPEKYINNFTGAHLYDYFFTYLKYYKKGISQTLLHKLKYKNRPGIGELVGFWLGNEIMKSNLDSKFDIIVPVPLHKSKIKKRGYNQSDTIAKGLSRATQISWSNKILLRKVNNPTQTNKSRIERINNVADIFSIGNKDYLGSKKILLVDDVITTGATMNACAELLLNKGASRISIATIAIAK